MKQTVQLGVLSAANIAITFLFQWYVLTLLGPGIETDALFAGMTLPQLVLAIVSGSLMHVLVPLLAKENDEQSHHDAWGFFILVCGLFGILALILYLTAPWWIPFTVPGFSESGQTLTIELTRIQLIGMVFAAANGVQWATYHARKQFLWAEFTPILSSALGLFLLIWALPKYGVFAAAWISTMRMGLQTLLLASGMGRPVWPNFQSRTIAEAWHRIKPLLLGTIYYKTDPLVDRFLLSTANSGSLSLYYLAQQIYGAASQVLNKAIAAPLVPLLSNFHKTKNKIEYKRAYYNTLYKIGTISLIGIFLLGIFGQSMIDLILKHRTVSSANVVDLWWIMICLSGMFFGGALGQISSSTFYAKGDTTTPTRIGIYTYTVYIPTKIVAYYYFGVFGLAFYTSIFVLVNFFIQHHHLRKFL